MKLLWLSLFFGFASIGFAQTYTNGPPFDIYKIEHLDENENEISSMDVEEFYMTIDKESKLITIFKPNEYYEKYFFSEYNKDIVAKGKYYDMFTIDHSYSSKSNENITDVLFFKKIPGTQRVSAIVKYFENQGFVTLYIR